MIRIFSARRVFGEHERIGVADALACPPEALKDVRVWGTVLGGTAFPANG